jgi:hypothetical protein
MDDILFGTPLGRPWPDVLLLGIRKYAQFALPRFTRSFRYSGQVYKHVLLMCEYVTEPTRHVESAICAKANEAEAPMTESK